MPFWCGFLVENPYFCRPKTGFYRVGAVAQLVEQRTENPCVGGSIPPHTTEKALVNNRSFFYLIFYSFPWTMILLMKCFDWPQSL